jgi:glycine/D-amino acid oxidase-like deaminating enzyme
VLQDPVDERLAALHAETLALHREVADLPAEPDGILVLGATDPGAFPARVRPELVEDASSVEPLVRPGHPAVRLHTGWAVGPATLTRAWWRRAERAGARLVVGDGPAAAGGRADAVLLATGAWTAGVDPLWGVTLRARTRVPCRHVLEEAGVDALVDGADGELFSLVGDVLGSSFSAAEPDPDRLAGRIAERAEAFIGPVEVTGARACPRPQAPGGLALTGRRDDGTWVCAGHGAWGISVGPASARAVAAELLA